MLNPNGMEDARGLVFFGHWWLTVGYNKSKKSWTAHFIIYFTCMHSPLLTGHNAIKSLDYYTSTNYGTAKKSS